MSKKPSISTLLSGFMSNTQINTIFQQILDALDNTVSRDGSTPNALEASLDLNSNDLLNVGEVHADDLYLNGNRVVSASATPTWMGAWTTATSYSKDNLVREDGQTYICLVGHTSDTFATDLTNNKWELMVSKGAAGSGTGDLLAANNLSDIASAETARANLGLGTVATESTLPLTKGGTGATTASAARTNLGLGGLAVLEVIDEDDMVTDSDTRPPSQQSVKAFVEDQISWVLIASSSTITSGTIEVTGLDDYSEIAVIGVGLTASIDSYRSLQVSSNSGSSWIATNYLYSGIGTSRNGLVGHSDSGAGTKNPYWSIIGFNKTWALKPADIKSYPTGGCYGILNANQFNSLRVYSSESSGTPSGNITGGTVYVFGKA